MRLARQFAGTRYDQPGVLSAASRCTAQRPSECLTPITVDEREGSFLVSNLEILVDQLWQVGITRIYANGSFVEEKDRPNDIDGYFECELRHFVSGRLERDLNALDPAHVWTWDATVAARTTIRIARVRKRNGQP